MNKKELAAALADKVDIPKEKASDAVDAVFASIEASLKGGDKVAIPGFGTFKVSERKARTARNPQTGDPIHIKASRVPRFTAAKGLKESVDHHHK